MAPVFIVIVLQLREVQKNAILAATSKVFWRVRVMARPQAAS